MADDIVKRLRHMAPLRCGETCPMCDGADEIERLRAAGDKLAAAVNDEHRPRFCEMDCPSRTAVEAWEKARRG